MAASFPMSFRNQTLRQHRRTILFEREKALLPAMQVFVEAKNNLRRTEQVKKSVMENYHVHHKRLQEEFNRNLLEKSKIYAEHRLIRDQARAENRPQREEEIIIYKAARKAHVTARAEYDEFYDKVFHPIAVTIAEINGQIHRWWHMYNTGENTGAGAVKTKREFLMRCPSEGCRGFLSTAYKCGVCEKSTCSDCLEVLGTENESVAHTCNPDSVESAKAIKKETHPCPKCGARIFKIDGCDQMWCTVEGCNTAFSWNTGHVVSGRVHNPHYYEWLRRNGGDAAAREVGDIPCGGLPHPGHFNRTLMDCQLSQEDKTKLWEIHRNVSDMEARLREYPARPDAMANKEIDVQYLMNDLTEAEWQRQLELAEARFNRKKEIGQILQTLVTGAADILGAVHIRNRDAIDARVAANRDFAAVRKTNENIRKLTVMKQFKEQAYRVGMTAGDEEYADKVAAEIFSLDEALSKFPVVPVGRLTEAESVCLNTERALEEVATWTHTVALAQLEGLRKYTNEAYITLSENLHMAVPQVSVQWHWMPIRALYRPSREVLIPQDQDSQAPTEVSV
jgi:hypothetical protein